MCLEEASLVSQTKILLADHDTAEQLVLQTSDLTVPQKKEWLSVTDSSVRSGSLMVFAARQLATGETVNGFRRELGHSVKGMGLSRHKQDQVKVKPGVTLPFTI